MDTPLLALLIPLEALALFYGQRRLFFVTEDALGSRLLALVLAAPGTVLHELAHLLMCLVLRVPVGSQVRGKIELFRPRAGEDGSMQLGRVEHAVTDPLRGALIAIAPVLLVPPLLYGLTVLLLGTGDLSQLPSALGETPIWRTALWVYVALSCGQAAFPSPGDHIGVLGGLCLLALTALAVALSVQDGPEDLLNALGAVGALMAIPALAAGGCLLLFGHMARQRARA